MRHRLPLAAAPLLIALFVAACTGGSASSAPTVAPVTAPPSVAASVAPSVAPSVAASVAPSMSAAGNSAAAGGGYSKNGDGGGASQAAGSGGGLALATTSLGSVLVGPTGNTLYMFTPDTSTTSACSGGCAANWPALTGTMPSLGTGLNASDFGTITRADGTTQVSFHGHPLYYFAGDQAAGDTKGQNLGPGKWYVLGSDGNPIK
jgi:predicted lipoprotein with Yx(FWY)xxD motif